MNDLLALSCSKSPTAMDGEGNFSGFWALQKPESLVSSFHEQSLLSPSFIWCGGCLGRRWRGNASTVYPILLRQLFHWFYFPLQWSMRHFNDLWATIIFHLMTRNDNRHNGSQKYMCVGFLLGWPDINNYTRGLLLQHWEQLSPQTHRNGTKCNQ